MAVGLLRSGDWPAARHIGRCAAPRRQPITIAARGISATLHSELRRRGGSICTPAVIGRCQRRRPVSPALRPIRQALARARRPQQNAIGLLHQVTMEVQHCQFGSLTVHVWLPPHVACACQGRTAAFLRWCVQPSY